MSDDLPAWAQKRAKPPERRPLWVVILGLAMLLSGTMGLAMGLRDLFKTGPARVSTRTVGGTEALQAFENAAALRAAAHPVATRASAVSRILMAALTLIAVGAVFSSHARARQAAILAGWVGIAHELIEAGSWAVVMGPGLSELGPLWSEFVTREGSIVGPPPSASVSAFTLAVGTVMMMLLGIAFRVLILTYFGGRRGRLFFGVGADQRPTAARQPNHGG